MSLSIDLAGKAALVTGGARGIGRAISQALARAGASVAVNYRKAGGPSEGPGQELVQEINGLGGRAVLTPGDISVKAEAGRIVQQTLDAFGRMDILVLNAARTPLKRFDRLLERDLRSLVENNFLGNIFMLQRSLDPLSQAGGRAVFISSLGSRFYHPEYPLGWMKAAMENVVMSWAAAFADRGVNVNGVCAGIVRTDSFRVLRLMWPALQYLPEDAFVPPEEVAQVVAFLCSPLAAGIRGQTIVVDRGMSAHLVPRTDALDRVQPKAQEETPR